MLRNGKLYGSVIPADVTSLHIRDVTLGEKIELQVIALTEHAVGKADRKTDIDKDSGKGSSQQEDKGKYNNITTLTWLFQSHGVYWHVVHYECSIFIMYSDVRSNC